MELDVFHVLVKLFEGDRIRLEMFPDDFILDSRERLECNGKKLDPRVNLDG